MVIWTTSFWSQPSWVLAPLHSGWRSAVVRQVTKDSFVSAVLLGIKDASQNRVSVASVSHVPVWEEAAILKQVLYSKKTVSVLTVNG